MKTADQLKPQGIFKLNVWESGVLIEQYEDKNLIVDTGLNRIASLLGGLSTDPVDEIGFGEGDAAPAAGDTDLTVGYVTKAFSAVALSGTGDVEFSFSLETSEGNGLAITEFGLFADGVLVSRKTRAAINKSSDIRLEGTWTIKF